VADEMPEQGIVDAHVHVYPPQVSRNPGAWGRAHGEHGWIECVAPEGRRSLQGWADPDELVAEMDRRGVASCVMQGWYWERQETCELQNRWYIEWIRRHPGRLLGFAAVQPREGRSALEALDRSLDSGLCGVGELLPQAHGATLDDTGWRRVIELAVIRRVPLTLHATDPEAGDAAGPRTPLEDFVRLAKEYPEGVFILAHWGGGLAFRGASLPPNLYFDMAASPLLYEPAVLRRAVDKVGAARIIYGSDFPLILYPRGPRVASMEPFLQEIGSAGLTESERAQIMGLNIRRLLSPGLAPARKHV